MSDTQPSPKWGAGHAQGMARAGLKEISRYLYAFPDNPGPVEEPGIAGNLTPQEIQSTKGFDARSQDAFHQSKSQAPVQKEPELER